MDVVASISEKVGDTVEGLGDYLREQRQHARLSVRQLATLAGVSNPYLSQVERGLRKPSAEVLQQIAKGLRISAEALYIRAGILDSEGLPDVEASIAADPLLTDRQRRALLDIYTSFRSENLRLVGERAASGSPIEPDDAPPAPVAEVAPVPAAEPITPPTKTAPPTKPAKGATRRPRTSRTTAPKE